VPRRTVSGATSIPAGPANYIEKHTSLQARADLNIGGNGTLCTILGACTLGGVDPQRGGSDFHVR